MASGTGLGPDEYEWFLRDAVKRGDLETVKDLTGARSTESTETRTILLTSLAQIACANGRLNVLQYLIEDLSVDINSCSNSPSIPKAGRFPYTPLGSSLLQISITHDDSHGPYEGYTGPTTEASNCTEWLTRRGANIHQENSEGEDALATARRAEHLQALGCLSCSLLDKYSAEMFPIGAPSGFHVYAIIRSSRDFLAILGVIWWIHAQHLPIDRVFPHLSDIFKTLHPHTIQSVCEEKSAGDYRWIGEPVCAFPHKGCASIWIVKIPLLTYIPQDKLMSRWTDAYNARRKSGIRGTATNAGLEVISTLDEYCYPDLSEEALKERNGDQVVRKYVERLPEKPSDGSPMLAISQAYLWKFHNEGNKRLIENAVLFSVMDISSCDDDTNSRSYPWDVHNYGAFRTAEEYIGVLLSNMLVECDILLQDDHTFNVPRLVTVFARSIARVQQDVNDYVQARSEIRIEKEKSFLHDIEDIREEISMIQTVLIQQETIWREFAFKAWPKLWKNGYDGPFEPDWKDDWEEQDQGKRYILDVKDVDVEHKWRAIKRPQEHFRKLRTQLDKLDRDAERVQRSIELKLDLKQRHASLKEARTASLMGASVLGFTIITIIFTPLSFMVGLFALPIDRFELAQSAAPEPSPGSSGSFSTGYIAKWMVTTELVSLAVTIICVLMALNYFIRGENGQNQLRWPHQSDQAERARGKDASGTVTSPEGAAASGNTPNVQREDTSRDAVGETGHAEPKQSARTWAISMLERLVNFLKDGREMSPPV